MTRPDASEPNDRAVVVREAVLGARLPGLARAQHRVLADPYERLEPFKRRVAKDIRGEADEE